MVQPLPRMPQRPTYAVAKWKSASLECGGSGFHLHWGEKKEDYWKGTKDTEGNLEAACCLGDCGIKSQDLCVRS